MAKINSIANRTYALTSDTGITATTGNITATLGDFVLTNGYVVLGASKGNSGEVLTSQGAGTVPIWAPASGGIAWTIMAADAGLLVNTGRINTKPGALLTATLPATAAVGTVIYLQGSATGSTGWKIAQNALQNIQLGNTSSTIGVGGYIASSNIEDGVCMVCTVADTTWTATSVIGNITVV